MTPLSTPAAQGTAALPDGWLKRDTAKAAARVAEWDNSRTEEKFMDVHEYVEDYEFRGDQDYTPNDHEKALIEDAILGYLGLASQSSEALPASGVEANRLGEMIYRALYEHEGGSWAAVDDRYKETVWNAAGRRLAAALTSAPAPAPSGSGVRPLDLSNVLKHAFLSGVVAAREIAGHEECDGPALWTKYEPYEPGAYERIRASLASDASPRGEAVQIYRWRPPGEDWSPWFAAPLPDPDGIEIETRTLYAHPAPATVEILRDAIDEAIERLDSYRGAAVEEVINLLTAALAPATEGRKG